MAFKRTFKPFASEITFDNRGRGISAPDVQTAIEKVYAEIIRTSPTLEIVSVKDFGAVGDGVADDTQAFKNAENAVSPGGVLYIPAGVYRINGYSPEKSVRLQGSSAYTTILKGGNIINAITYLDGGLHLENLTLDQEGVRGTNTDTGAVMRLHNIYPLSIISCRFVNLARGIWHTMSEEHVGETKTHGVLIKDSYFTYAPSVWGQVSDPGVINIHTSLNDGLVIGNTFENCCGTALRIFPYGVSGEQIAPRRWTIVDNFIKNTRSSSGTAKALYYRGHDLVFSRNHVHNTQSNMLDIQGPDDQGTIADNIRITDNTLITDDGYTSDDYAAGVLLRSVNVIFANNHLKGDSTAKTVPSLETKWGCDYTIITGNFISGKGEAISLRTGTLNVGYGNMGHVIISNNILAMSVSSRCAITMNSFDGHTIYQALIRDNTFFGTTRGFVEVVNNNPETYPRCVHYLSLVGNSTLSANGPILKIDDPEWVNRLTIFNTGERAHMSSSHLILGEIWGTFRNTITPPETPKNGTQYFDPTLKKPLWYYNGEWYDGTGNPVSLE